MMISNIKTIAATGKAGNQFVGIKVYNNQVEFHYPETYKLSDNEEGFRNNILSLLRTVTLAKTKTDDHSSYNSEHTSEHVFPLGAYLWIINDYLTYHRYENREKHYVHGYSGRINWKRTMRTNPIISQGSVIYSEVISEKKSQKDNILTEIYNFCVQNAVDSIGWLYGVSFDADGIDYYKLFNEKQYLEALNVEISNTFDDQKKTRLYNMKNIITGLDDSMIDTREFVYGVDSYEYIFERMIDAMFSTVNNIRDFYPNASWNLVLEDAPIESSNLRPDTILIKDNNVYILDAKYYRYGTTFNPSDMPETTSIQKQITYGEYVKKAKSGQYKNVYNAFVLPYSSTANVHSNILHDKLQFIGVASASWMDDSSEENNKIAAVLIDTNYLIHSWAHRNEDDLNSIIEVIEKNIKGVDYEQY